MVGGGWGVGGEERMEEEKRRGFGGGLLSVHWVKIC